MKPDDETVNPRESLIDFFREQLIGPADGEAEEMIGTPLKRYAAGILFPQGTESKDVTADEEDDEQSSSGESDTDVESPVSMAFQRLPASMGISFLIAGEPSVECDVWAASYAPLEGEGGEQGSSRWRRSSFASRPAPERVTLDRDNETQKLFDDRAEISAIWRPVGSGFLVTVTLLNLRAVKPKKPVSATDCLFQVGFRCEASSGSTITAYPSTGRLTHDDEEEELALMYRRQQTFAIGHGCAATWDADAAGQKAQWVEASVVPSREVKPMTAKLDREEKDKGVGEALGLQWLMDPSLSTDELRNGLTAFVDSYDRWISGLDGEAVVSGFEQAKSRILARLREALKRIRRGVETLCDPDRPMIREAFQIATRAMLMQMVHSSDSRAGQIRDVGHGIVDEPDYGSAVFADRRWYPFQLAFQLLVINSLVDETDEDRDERQLVDLIWFPTGGGKTEAYLALSAFEIVYRRLVHGDAGGGTVVITRYTLRLLTSQQFERTAALIVALDRIRQEDPARFGQEPMSLGMWVGGDTTPNHLSGDLDGKSAEALYNALLDAHKPENPFPLQKCPWCGTRLVPSTRSPDPSDYGVYADPNECRFYCVDDRCPCHQGIPVRIVDEELYREPPTFLVATVDKFARLAWEPRSSAFMGATNNRLPPSLIVQDELHLISGPLGTIAGGYEAAIDLLLSRDGRRPKIVAATATIRRASDQVRSLYARDVRVFPPPGLDANNSHYSRVDEKSDGRLYLGVMAQGHTRMFALVQVAATLSQAPIKLGLADDALDAYWTQVIYHNSRRELGKTMTLARDDVPSRIQIIESDAASRRKIRIVEELSANVKGTRIGEVLERLNSGIESGAAVDVLACTNMISVGVDIPRLSLMLVYGQPKTTSEYIQASSRVGRNASRPPGLVVTLYAPTKPRDRSHYESFSSYHQSLYRYVEPSSVTPFAPPARDRTMHAALVIAMRHLGGLEKNRDAARFDASVAGVAEIIERLRERMIEADPDEKRAIEAGLEALIDTWSAAVAGGGSPLRFSYDGGRNYRCLLRTYDEGREGVWKTLNSMRHVDQESLVVVRGGWS